MYTKKRGFVYIAIGTILFIIGLALIYSDLITIGVVFVAFGGAFTLPGFFVITSKDEPDSKNYNGSYQKKSFETPRYNRTDNIENTVLSHLELIDSAFSKCSKLIYKRTTAQLDYCIYVFFKSYIIICNARIEELASTYARIAFDRIVDHFSSRMDEAKINRIIDQRLEEYDEIVRTSESFMDPFMFAVEQHLIKDLFFESDEFNEIAITGADKQFEIISEIFILDQYIFPQITHRYDKVIEEWI